MPTTETTPTETPQRDVTKSTLPPQTYGEMAEELLARFPGVDRAELLKEMTAHYFRVRRWGNKREERAACDFLNDVQEYAVLQLKRAEKAKASLDTASEVKPRSDAGQ